MTRNAGGNGLDYRESDMRLLLRERGPWTRWDDAVRWLHMIGSDDPQLRPSLVKRLMTDLQQLVLDGVPYTDDPGEAFKLARAHRRRPGHGQQRRVMPHKLHAPYPRV